MSKTTDRKRKVSSAAARRKARQRWKAAVVKARQVWKQQQAAGRHRRFKAGKEVKAHLSGYWDQVLEIARQIFGGPKP